MSERYTTDVESAINKILTSADRGHRDAIRAALDPSQISLPPTVAKRLKSNAKTFSFQKEGPLVTLEGNLLLLRIFGHWDKAEPIIERIRSVPRMNWGQFELLRMIVQDARWFAAREGNIALLDRLTENLFDDDYKPLFLEAGKPVFKFPLDDPEVRELVGLDERPGGYALPVLARPAYFLTDLSLLSTIWAYGGSPVWPLERLERERIRLEAGLLELPGMS